MIRKQALRTTPNQQWAKECSDRQNNFLRSLLDKVEEKGGKIDDIWNAVNNGGVTLNEVAEILVRSGSCGLTLKSVTVPLIAQSFSWKEAVTGAKEFLKIGGYITEELFPLRKQFGEQYDLCIASFGVPLTVDEVTELFNNWCILQPSLADILGFAMNFEKCEITSLYVFCEKPRNIDDFTMMLRLGNNALNTVFLQRRGEREKLFFLVRAPKELVTVYD